MSNNRQHILASLLVATLVLSLATIALTTDDTQAKFKKPKAPRDDDPQRNSCYNNCGPQQNNENEVGKNNYNDKDKKGDPGGQGQDGNDGTDINCDKNGCH
jgi:hypothetical protein